MDSRFRGNDGGGAVQRRDGRSGGARRRDDGKWHPVQVPSFPRKRESTRNREPGEDPQSPPSSWRRSQLTRDCTMIEAFEIAGGERHRVGGGGGVLLGHGSEQGGMLLSHPYVA